jgi:hypothetical protein
MKRWVVFMNGESQEKQKYTSVYILLGAILGAITGAGAGYLLTKRIEEGEELQLTPGDGIKIGGSIITFLRQISTLGK